MGTNYYIEEKESCPTCGRDYDTYDKGKHIGKSSAGWCFALHVYPEIGINNLNDWKEFWKNKIIVDECDEVITEEGMLDIIINRHWNNRHWNTVENRDNNWFKINHAVPGPNDLARHEINSHCIGHGEGTWDLMIGDFS